jgi:peptidase M28-like protein/PDZ domain-containing protein
MGTMPLDLLLLLLPGAGCLPGDAASLATIKASELRAHVEFLASDELEGREAGTEAEGVAAAYLASRLHAIGLKPGGDEGGWLQHFRQGERVMRNVVGILEGSDPRRRSEVVVLGAHFDHVGRGGAQSGGMGPKGEIHNGADDNASGTAALLELAEAFASAPPARTLVFAHFSGEEKGLLGSKHYVESPALPLESTVAMVNIDMIGRSRERYLFVGGLGTSPGWPAIVARAGESEKLALETAEGGRAPSDNTPFYEKGIPCLFLFTNIHEDYHGPGDDAEKLDYSGMERIGRAAWRLVAEVANAEGRLPFKEADSTALPADFGKRMRERMGGNRVRLGVRTGEPGPEGGLPVEEVFEGSPAGSAGILDGDLLLAIGDAPLRTRSELMTALGKVKRGESARLRIRRGAEEISVEVRFPAEAPSRSSESRPARRDP